MTDNKETLRLASIVEVFNEAVGNYIEADAAVQKQLKAAMTPALEDEMAERAEDLFDAATEMMIGGESEEGSVVVAQHMMGFINALLVAVQNAGLEHDVAKLFPAAEKTQRNADAFAQAGYPNIARLCFK